MKLIVNESDISELAEKIVWSGELAQAARRLEFTIAYKSTDKYLPKPVVNVGDKVKLYSDDGGMLFWGQIFSRNYSATGSTVSFIAFDFLIFLTKSKINKILDDTPEGITKTVCTELGVPFGSAAHTGIKTYIAALAKSGYEAIMAAYTRASKTTGKKYMPKMDGDKLTVIEVGSTLSGVLLDGNSSLIDATYGESIENMVNRVIIADKNKNTIGSVENAADRVRYGTLQEVYNEEDDKDAKTAAKGLLRELEQTASVTAIDNIRCVTGYAVGIQEPITGLCGRFYITSDSHTYQNAAVQMQLGLSFVNIMDEKEIES